MTSFFYSFQQVIHWIWILVITCKVYGSASDSLGRRQGLTLTPQSGPCKGGTPVLITADNFTDGRYLSCVFGDTTVPARIISLTEIECVSPPSFMNAATVDLRVRSNGFDDSLSSLRFRYYEEPTISFAGPLHGPYTGGTAVVIVLDDLQAAETLLCMFGMVVVIGSLINSTAMSCVSPPMTASPNIYITISLNGVDFSISVTEPFVYHSPSVVESINPTFGSIRGGTLLKVRGSGFVDHGMRCWFGNALWTIAEYISDREVDCRSPESPDVGVFALSVKPEDHLFSSLSYSFFQYVTEIHLISLSPQSGPCKGGTPVLITGNNFTDGRYLSCVFGDTTVPARLISSTEVECASPPSFMNAAAVDLRVRSNGFDDSLSSLRFRYYEEPTISLAGPLHGPYTGGTAVVIVLDDLQAAETLFCMFGMVVVIGSLINSTAMSCVSPPMTASPNVYITISLNGVDFSISVTEPFVYHSPSVVESINPTFGSIRGGTLLKVRGSGFVDHGMRCWFGNALWTIAEYISDREIECMIPESPSQVTLPLSVSYNFDASARFPSTDDIIYRYIAELEAGASNPFDSDALAASLIDYVTVSSIEPDFGYLTGGAKVNVLGRGFHQFESWWCKFGYLLAQSYPSESDGLLACYSPSYNSTSETDVTFQLCRDPVNCYGNHTFRFIRALGIRGIHPDKGPVSGGTKVSISLTVPLVGKSFCHFGEKISNVVIDGLENVWCKSPPYIELEHNLIVPFAVSVDGVSFSDQIINFEYVAFMRIVAVNPPRILNHTVLTIVIEVEKVLYKQDMECVFQREKRTKTIVLSNTSLRCECPALEAGDVEFYMSIGGRSVITDSIFIRVLPTPRIQEIYPLSGPSGTRVQLRGLPKNVWSDVFCHFGSSVVQSDMLGEASVVECISPFHADYGEVSLYLSLDGYHSWDTSSYFTYIQKPNVEHIWPLSVDVSRKEFVTKLSGNNLHIYMDDNVICNIGNFSSTVVTVSPVEISCYFYGSFPIGYYQVRVISSTFPSLISPKFISVVPSPILLSSRSSWDETCSCERIDIRGDNFHDVNFTCFFDLKARKPIIVTGFSNAVCVVPKDLYKSYELRISNDGYTMSSNFTVLSPLSITSVTLMEPERGLTDNMIAVFGRNFFPNATLHCLFGEAATDATVFNSTLLLCPSPSRISSGTNTVPFNVLLNGRKLSSRNDLYYTFIDASLQALTPHYGSADGGTIVSIALTSGLPDGSISHCWFGTSQVEVLYMTRCEGKGSLCTEVICRSPPSDGRLVVPVRLSTNRQDRTNDKLFFGYISSPVVTSIFPTIGFETGGTVIRIAGAGFPNSPDYACRLGNTTVVATWASGDSVTCETPPLRPDVYKLYLSVNGIDFEQISSTAIEIRSTVSVAYCSPVSGSTLGGSFVSIHGKGFRFTDDINCFFGKLRTKSTFLSGNEVQCVTPPSDAGPSAITVRVNGILAVSSYNLTFFFFKPMSFFGKGDISGNYRGGTVVLITASDNITQSTGSWECLFKDEKVLATKLSDFSLSCLSPAGLAGSSIIIFIRHENEIFPVENCTFHYHNEFAISRIDPIFGPEFNEQDIVVHGGQFEPNLRYCCLFGSEYIADATRVTHSSLHCPLTMTASPRLYNLSISLHCDGYASSSDFRLTTRMEIHAVLPSSGLVGGSIIKIYGSNYLPYVGLQCDFNGTTTTDATVFNSTLLLCPSPSRISSGTNTVPFNVLLNGRKLSSRNDLYYTFIDASLQALTPHYGSADGGTIVSITLTSGLPDGSISHCWFGTSQVEVLYMTRCEGKGSLCTEVICRSPPSDGRLVVPVRLSTNRQDRTNDKLFFGYISSPVVTSIFPTIGFETGGTVIRIAGAGFPNSPDYACRLGNTTVVATWVSSDSVTCETPPLLPGVYAFNLGTHEKSCEYNHHNSFQFVVNPVYTFNEASFSSNALIVVTGSGFWWTPSIFYRRGDSTRKCSLIDKYRIACASSKSPLSFGASDWDSFAVSFNGVDFSRPSMVGSDVNLVDIDALDPSNGTMVGGYRITLSRKCCAGLKDILCKFGRHVIRAESSHPVECLVPPKSVGDDWSVPVSISADGGSTWSSVHYFRYLSSFHVSNFEPNQGPSAGGNRVVVQFEESPRIGLLRCVFGSEVSIQNDRVSEDHLSCIAPPHLPGKVQFSITDGNLTFTVGSYEYWLEPVIAEVQPLSGPISGGTKVFFKGKRFIFGGKTYCFFGTERVPANVKNEFVIECISPPKSSRSIVTVEVGIETAFLHRYPWKHGNFTYSELDAHAYSMNRNLNLGDKLFSHALQPSSRVQSTSITPEIRSIWPAYAFVNRRVEVTIEGSNLRHQYFCQFGYNRTKVAVASRTTNTISCFTPLVDQPTTLPLLLIAEDSALTSTGFQLEFRGSCSISRTEPTWGSIMARASIIVHGKSFINTKSLVCLFDSFISPALYMNPNAVKCVVPYSSESSMSLRVALNTHGDKCDNNISLSLRKPPFLSYTAPNDAPIGTTVNVSIVGENFVLAEKLFCIIGNIRIKAHFHSSMLIVCDVAIFHELGTLSVLLSTDEHLSNSLPFIVMPQISVLSVEPPTILWERSTLLKVHGAFFINSPSLSCAFDRLHLTPARWLSSELIECESPQFDWKLRTIDRTILSVSANNGSHYTDTEYSLTILHDTDEVISMIPNYGLTTGGFDIEVTFHKPMITPHTCVFGMLSVPVMEGSKPMTINCRVPPHPLGAVEVSLRASSYRLNVGVFHFISPEGVSPLETELNESAATSVSIIEPLVFFTQPSLIPDSGGTMVFITGSRFVDSNRLFCRFGQYKVLAHFFSDSQVACKSPALSVSSNGAIELTVTTDDSLYSRPLRLQIYRVPVILSVEPSQGYSYGRTLVTIVLRHFTFLTGLKCRFGQYDVIAHFRHNSSISCATPDTDIHDSVLVSLTFNGVDYHDGRGNLMFTFLSPFKIVSMHPRHGLRQGNTRVIVKVDSINYGIPVCWFGSSNPVRSLQLDNNTIMCISPIFNASSSYQRFYVLHDGVYPHEIDPFSVFTFVDEIVAYEVSPPIGSVLGGTAVSIRVVETLVTASSIRCVFGTVMVAGAFISEREVTCLTPPFDREDQVPVKVISHVQTAPKAFTAARFRYTFQPYLSDMFPRGGASNGGTVVHIYGQLFPPDALPHLTLCRFGNLQTVPARFVSNQEITCKTPPLVGVNDFRATTDVSVTFNGVDYVGNQSFKYAPPLQVSDISPRFGSVYGGTAVYATVICSDCSFISNAECHFGPWIVRPHEMTRNAGSFTLTCFSPNVSDRQLDEVTFEVSINGGNDMSTSKRKFGFTHYPEVTGAFPSSGWASGGDDITVEGFGFTPKYDLICLFGSIKALMVQRVSNHRIICSTPHMELITGRYTVSIQVSIVGLEVQTPTSPVLFHFFPVPSIMNVQSLTVPSEADSNSIRVTGKFLSSAIACRMGSVGGDFANVTIHSDNTITCISSMRKGDRNSEEYPSDRLYVLFEAGLLDSGFTIDEKGPEDLNKSSSSEEPLHPPIIQDILPRISSSSGGQYITIRGDHFTQGEGLACVFGDTVSVQATFITSHKLRCTTPELVPGYYPLHVQNGKSHLPSKRGHLYTAWKDINLISVSPKYGPCKGGTRTVIHFNSLLLSENEGNRDIVCLFGAVKVQGFINSADSVSCFAPAAFEPLPVAIKISTDSGLTFSTNSLWYTYHSEPHLVDLQPNFCSLSGGTTITVYGHNFMQTPELICRYGDVLVQAIFISPSSLACTSPVWKLPDVVPFEISLNGVDFTHSGFTFQFIKTEVHYAPKAGITSVRTSTLLRSFPTRGFSGTPVFIVGNTFYNETGLMCQFGDVNVDAVLISKTVVFCSSPAAHRSTTVDLKIASDLGLFINYNKLSFRVETGCHEGMYCGIHRSLARPTPNGTFASNANSQNFTLCAPGSYAPESRNTLCLQCPVSFICPDFGLSKPVICPAGYICGKTGLISPQYLCPQGYFCGTGTKDRHPQQHYHNRIDEPLMIGDLHDFERPIACPAGFFCKDGVRTNISIIHNFSTPQPCYDGFFCPPGSVSPEGTGACPTGYYCHNWSKILCPIGFYCPGVGNTFPKKCLPGTYSESTGNSRCKLCPVGQMCHLSGMSEPQPCSAGMVCDSEGLSIPEKPCPPGYVCSIGTGTSDPLKTADWALRAAVKCPAGYFCPGGVANYSQIERLPEQESTVLLSPLPCSEGYYCGEGSISPSGSGVCFPGHYCPTGTDYPIPVPVGTFADQGSITPNVCFPGSYAPTKGSISCKTCPAGSHCLGYGDYIPKICDPGTYRSTADSITCKPCPAGTFNPFKGATDISNCFPCPAGRICSIRGMYTLEQSIPCHSGFACASSTDKSSQYDHPCPGGFSCDDGTTPSNQYYLPCKRGYVCARGTPFNEQGKNSCPSFYTCSKGTATISYKMNGCPFQTSSLMGSYFLRSCTVQNVDVCDKNDTEISDPTKTSTYYPLPGFGNLFDITKDKVIKVIEKVIPFNTDQSSMWKNDVAVVQRSCPTYFFDGGVTKTETSGLNFTLIGRNFKNSTNIYCRYRAPVGDALVMDGVFLSSTRITCPAPLILSKTLRDRALPDYCEKDGNGIIYFKHHCENAIDLDCVGSLIVDGRRYKRYYEIVIPCTSEERAIGNCQNLPFDKMKFNPCFASSIAIDVSFDGRKFSGDQSFIPLSTVSVSYTSYRTPFVAGPSNTTIVFVHPQLSESAMIVPSVEDEFDHLLYEPYAAYTNVCMDIKWIEEGEKSSEQGWFLLPFMHQAHLSIDWRHIPMDMEYNVHFKLAIFIRPSRCFDLRCNEHRKLIWSEKEPCVNAIELPTWFLDDTVDKHATLNLTLMALDDAVFRVEIQILDGLYLPSSDFFLETLSWEISSPHRARTVKAGSVTDVRPLSPYLTWSGNSTPMEYFFVTHLSTSHTNMFSTPLNLPPRWDSYGSGRVLISMNVSAQSHVPTVTDSYSDILNSNEYWANPFVSPEAAKERTDLFLETFHGLSFIDGKYSYEMSDMLLPYLPYLSNCREFDSYVTFSQLIESPSCSLPAESSEYPANWWRRKFSPIPHVDSVRSVGPFDYNMFYPIADWCERRLRCSYEERLAFTDVRPRWFEANDGDVIFNMIREPLNYYEFTGRDRPLPNENDGGGQRYVKQNQLFELYIPVKVATNVADYLAGICAGPLCYPRKISLDISYYQVDKFRKRLVEANIVYGKYDRDFTKKDYEVYVTFRPLNYRELLIKFAYDRHVFVLLFLAIGFSTVLVSFFYWFIVRITTRLQHPPKMQFLHLLGLIFSPAITGFILGMLPIFVLTVSTTVIIGGYQSLNESRTWSFASMTMFIKSTIDRMKNFSNKSAIMSGLGKGRLGIIFLSVGVLSLFEGSKILVPDKGGSQDEKKASNSSRQRRRSNLILCSILMGVIITLIVEWSYSSWFGNYIWESIILMKFFNIIIGDIVDAHLGESLLSAPIMAALSIAQSVVTLSANDFIDFLLSYIVGYGLLILDRMYFSPFVVPLVKDGVSEVAERSTEFVRLYLRRIHRKIFKKQGIQRRCDLGREKPSKDPMASIIDSYGDYCLDTLSLLYLPYAIFLLMVFREETEIPARYSIKEHDMQQYLLFSLVIIPFQIFADVYIHSSLELFHGFKIREYLAYCRYRFSQRQSTWRGRDHTLDKSLQESMRSLDQTCFSSQFYMMITIHVNGIIYIVIGLEIISRAEYNPFADSASPILVICVIILSLVVKTLTIVSGSLLGIWRVKRNSSHWYKTFRERNMNLTMTETETGKKEDKPYDIDKILRSETFRHRFLSMNRSWLISQLPEILSPKTMQRSRPFLRNQFAQILNKVNGSISSDDESDIPQRTFDFTGQYISVSAKNMLSQWVVRARKKQTMRSLVQPLIEHAKREYCEQCQSRKDLRVKLLQSLEDLVHSFLEERPDDDAVLDHVRWKRYWYQNQRYQTLCIPCLSFEKDQSQKKIADKAVVDKTLGWGPVHLEGTGKAIMKKWYLEARGQSTNGTSIKPNNNEISDDDEDDSITLDQRASDIQIEPKASKIASSWLTIARFNLNRKRSKTVVA